MNNHGGYSFHKNLAKYEKAWRRKECSKNPIKQNSKGWLDKRLLWLFVDYLVEYVLDY